MTSVELILYAAITIVVAVAICWFILRKGAIEEKSVKWLLFIATIIIALLCDGLLLGLNKISAQADNLIVSTTQNAEDYLNAEQPDYTNQLISPEGLKLLINEHKSLEAFLQENEAAGWLADLIASRSLRKTLSTVTDQADKMLTSFEEEQTPFTIHNILLYITVNTRSAIQNTTARLQLATLILAAVGYLIILFMYMANKKGWFTTRSGGVTFGDEI